MPTSFIYTLGPKGEEYWSKAKSIVDKQYDLDKDNDSYWALVTSISKRLAGKEDEEFMSSDINLIADLLEYGDEDTTSILERSRSSARIRRSSKRRRDLMATKSESKESPPASVAPASYGEGPASTARRTPNEPAPSATKSKPKQTNAAWRTKSGDIVLTTPDKPVTRIPGTKSNVVKSSPRTISKPKNDGTSSITAGSDKFDLDSAIATQAKRLNVDPRHLRAIADVESGSIEGSKRFSVVGDKHKKEKARGIYQVRGPALRDVNRFYGTKFTEKDMNDPSKNVEVGAKYYAMQRDAYKAKDPYAMAQGYNAGPGRKSPDYLKKFKSALKGLG